MAKQPIPTVAALASQLWNAKQDLHMKNALCTMLSKIIIQQEDLILQLQGHRLARREDLESRVLSFEEECNRRMAAQDELINHQWKDKWERLQAGLLTSERALAEKVAELSELQCSLSSLQEDFEEERFNMENKMRYLNSVLMERELEIESLHERLQRRACSCDMHPLVPLLKPDTFTPSRLEVLPATTTTRIDDVHTSRPITLPQQIVT
eukprot:GILK01013503.1.p1 GENE.GILK01013503.1~~GILK01013503.1.p1  ORF type:complete len:210 (-),score=34.54 GILK01013503.1:70-699(-)